MKIDVEASLARKCIVRRGCTKWLEFVKLLVTSKAAEQPHLILLQAALKLDDIPDVLP